MICDFHTHILPGVDDGSRDVEQSLQMLRLMHSQGFSRVVATPHFYGDRHSPKEFLRRRADAFRALQAAVGDEPLPEIILGAEVYYFPGISACDNLQDLCLAGTSAILVELPMGDWSERLLRELEELAGNGFTPILAHIDRYPRTAFRKLAQMPVLIQANGEFFGNCLTRSLALRMLREGRIHLLGSDCHNMTKRIPNLDWAVELIRRKLGQEALDRLTYWEKQVLDSRADEVL